MCTCSIYAYLYYKNTQEGKLIDKISETIEENRILDTMIEVGKYPRLVGFSLGLISKGFSKEYLNKVLFNENSDTEKKVFILYYYFGRKISDDNMQVDEKIRELAENIITENSLDFNIRLPALIFCNDPNKYFDKMVSEFVNPKFYELAFGIIAYSEDNFNIISDLYVENVVKYLLISKILRWNNVIYLSKEKEKKFEYFLIIEKKGYLIISKLGFILILLTVFTATIAVITIKFDTFISYICGMIAGLLFTLYAIVDNKIKKEKKYD
ncbi:MAG: hypothetical protein ACP5JU_03270 [Minisyncoccia bacterium]